VSVGITAGLVKGSTVAERIVRMGKARRDGMERGGLSLGAVQVRAGMSASEGSTWWGTSRGRVWTFDGVVASKALRFKRLVATG